MSDAILLLGNCLDSMRDLPDASIDSVVTDPPYGLSFMGKKWDYDVPSVEIWREVLRVLKPGGHVLSFWGTRTYHRMVVNMEDAGFEIRDQLQWIYGSGFPKSLDVSKAIDKAAGAEREVVGLGVKGGNMRGGNLLKNEKKETEQFYQTAPSTDAAKQWQGWGTALKPANEPICLARKPLEGTVAHNVQKHGVGGINVDGCRIALEDKLARPFNEANNDILGKYARFGNPVEPQGRWPANVIFDEESSKLLDEQSGVSKSQRARKINAAASDSFGTFITKDRKTSMPEDNGGGASRFFYVAKASKRERNAGLEGMPEKVSGAYGEYAGDGRGRQTEHQPAANHHPTVKPVQLMRYLTRLITPPGGVCLDPFIGSGTTGVACKKEGFDFIGCEMNAEYLEIAQKRIDNEDNN